MLAVVIVIFFAVGTENNPDFPEFIRSTERMLLVAVGACVLVCGSVAVGLGVPILAQAVMGMSFGFQFYGVRVFNWEYCIRSTGMGWTRAKPAWHGLTMLPKNLEGSVRLYKIYELVGVLASAAMLVVSMTIYRLLVPDGIFTEAFQSGLASGVVATVAMVIGICALLHIFRFGLMGRMVHPELYNFNLAYQMATIPWSFGQRASDWNREAIAYITAFDHPHKIFRSWAYLIAYYHALDSKEDARAIDLIDQAISFLGNSELKNNRAYALMFCEAAYAHALIAHDPSAATFLPNKDPWSKKDNPIYGRAKAAVLLAEGKTDEAKELAEGIKAAFISTLTFPLQDNELAEISFLERVIQNAQTDASA